MERWSTILCALALLFLAAPATPTEVPVEAQAATFAKVFRYDPALAGIERPAVLVPIGFDDAAPLIAALEGAGLAPRTVDLASTVEALDAADAVYLRSDTATPEILWTAIETGTLTITDSVDLVERGAATVGLSFEADRVEILVHRERLRAEGHTLSAQLLKLATVVSTPLTVGFPSGTPASSSPDIEPPQLVSFRSPAYPRLARRLGLEGDVLLRLMISASGEIEAVDLLEGVDDGHGLNEAALEAARGAVYRPATLDGRPIAVTHLLRVPFRLEPD